MADKLFSTLPLEEDITAADEVLVVVGGVARRSTVGELLEMDGISDAIKARTNLGLSSLAPLLGMSKATGQMIIGNGGSWTSISGEALLAAIGAASTGSLAETNSIVDYVDSSSFNYILNGNFSVDRLGGSTRNPGIGVYTFDIWKGHANGLEQIVESLPANTYTLFFGNGGLGSVGGQTPKASPAVFTTSVAGNTSVVVPENATDVMLLKGDHSDVAEVEFKARPKQIEELMLSRYYLPKIRISGSGNASSSGQTARCNMNINFPVPMASEPSASYIVYTSINVKANPFSGTDNRDARSISFSPESNGSGSTVWVGEVTFESRITA